MRLLYIRIFFVFLSALLGFQIFRDLKIGGAYSGLIGSSAGLVFSFLLIVLEATFKNVTVRGLSAVVFGLLLGLIIGNIFSNMVSVMFPMEQTLANAIKIMMVVVFCYFGMIMALKGKDEFNLIIPYIKFARQDVKQDIILLDTSVIIDGRIADICETKFIDGRILIPRFVLNELQMVSDSSDSLKRNRGRRGLDMLHRLQQSTKVDVKVHEDDFPEIREVDEKLVRLGKLLEAKIITNDYNLNKVAEIQGVHVLNINDLANALKPVVLPGEEMEVQIIKEGKEYNQGVAYLSDGTMVVVENARNIIGQKKTVYITSVLQTSAGRMIFAKLG